MIPILILLFSMTAVYEHRMIEADYYDVLNYSIRWWAVLCYVLWCCTDADITHAQYLLWKRTYDSIDSSIPNNHFLYLPHFIVFLTHIWPQSNITLLFHISYFFIISFMYFLLLGHPTQGPFFLLKGLLAALKKVHTSPNFSIFSFKSIYCIINFYDLSHVLV